MPRYTCVDARSLLQSCAVGAYLVLVLWTHRDVYVRVSRDENPTITDNTEQGTRCERGMEACVLQHVQHPVRNITQHPVFDAAFSGSCSRTE